MRKSRPLGTPEGGELHLQNVGLGSQPEVSDGHENVRFRGQSGPHFRAAACLLVAISGLKPLRNFNRILAHRDAGVGSRRQYQLQGFCRTNW